MKSFIRKYRGHGIYLLVYFSIYTVINSFIEPLGWFGLDEWLKSLKVWGNIIIVSIPAILTVVYFYFVSKNWGDSELTNYLGIAKVSTGSGRDEAFQSIRQRANKRIVIVGIGMTNLSRYARKTLALQAQNVKIDLLMIDPDFLETNPCFAAKLEEFLDIRDFIPSVRTSFETLKLFCEEWNSCKDNTYKISLRVYSTIPTMSMVMIDPGEVNAEMVLEFFLYQSGEYRPRFLVKKIEASDNLFSRVMTEFTRLWSKSKEIV